jgi:hypothetical protein
MVEHRELSQGRALELAPNFSPVVPMELTCQSSLPRDFPGEVSGARSDRKQLIRKQLIGLMALLARDDVLVVARFDRLAR